VLPVEAQTIREAPASSARATATTIPRSLKLPVGLSPSNLKWSSTPSRSPATRERMSGVDPSPRLSAGVSAPTGSRSR
jgi:hypothetical protein